VIPEGGLASFLRCRSQFLAMVGRGGKRGDKGKRRRLKPLDKMVSVPWFQSPGLGMRLFGL